MTSIRATSPKDSRFKKALPAYKPRKRFLIFYRLASPLPTPEFSPRLHKQRVTLQIGPMGTNEHLERIATALERLVEISEKEVEARAERREDWNEVVQKFNNRLDKVFAPRWTEE